MSEDLIKRSAAIRALNREKSDWNCDYNVPIDNCIKRLNKVKSADRPKPTHGYMWICPECGLDVHSDFKECPRCGYARDDRPQGEWIEKAISIIDDMQSGGIVDCEQAQEFRMRARMRGVNNE